MRTSSSTNTASKSCSASAPPGLSAEVRVRDLVIAQAAFTDSGIVRDGFRSYNFAPIGDYGLLRSQPTRRRQGVSFKVGNILSSDIFYHVEPGSRLWGGWLSHGVLAVEMETAALYTLARVRRQGAQHLRGERRPDPARIHVGRRPQSSLTEMDRAGPRRRGRMRARDRLASHSAAGRAAQCRAGGGAGGATGQALVAEFAELLSTGTVADDCAAPRCNHGRDLERRLQTIEQPAKRARVEKC